MSKSIDLPVPSLVLVSGLDRSSLAAATTAASAPRADVIDVSGGLPPGADTDFVDALRPQAALPRHGVVTGIAPANAKLRRTLLARAERRQIAAVSWLVHPSLEHLARNAPLTARRRLERQWSETERIASRAGQPKQALHHVLRHPHDIEARPVSLPCDARHLRGPLDLVGDVHACHPELVALLDALGYRPGLHGALTHPDGRRLVFLGDLVDRGPEPCRVLELAMAAHEAGTALIVRGNHDDKLDRLLRGNPVSIGNSLGRTVEALRTWGTAFERRVADFLTRLPTHLLFAGGNLLACHAGLPEHLHLGVGKAVRHHALYGDPDRMQSSPDGEIVRNDWALDYTGHTLVVHGHVPVANLAWRNRTLDLDTGCCFGGYLSALRWPELETVQIPAARNWYGQGRKLPFLDPLGPAPKSGARAT